MSLFVVRIVAPIPKQTEMDRTVKKKVGWSKTVHFSNHGKQDPKLQEETPPFFKLCYVLPNHKDDVMMLYEVVIYAEGGGEWRGITLIII